MNPLYLAVGVTLTASNAFMLPVSTPSNAIVYTAGGIRYRGIGRPVQKSSLLKLHKRTVALAGEEYFSFFLNICFGFWSPFFLCVLTGKA